MPPILSVFVPLEMDEVERGDVRKSTKAEADVELLRTLSTAEIGPPAEPHTLAGKTHDGSE